MENLGQVNVHLTAEITLLFVRIWPIYDVIHKQRIAISTYYRRTFYVKNQLIPLRTLGEEAVGGTALRPKSTLFMLSAITTLCFAAYSVQ